MNHDHDSSSKRGMLCQPGSVCMPFTDFLAQST